MTRVMVGMGFVVHYAIDGVTLCGKPAGRKYGRQDSPADCRSCQTVAGERKAGSRK